jgi:hypothetical protein
MLIDYVNVLDANQAMDYKDGIGNVWNVNLKIRQGEPQVFYPRELLPPTSSE